MLGRSRVARPLRIDIAGGFYHVMARGIERRAVFHTDECRLHWKKLVGSLPERFGMRMHAWVLMGNHYHLQIETPEANLSVAMQWLNVSYAGWFNRRFRRNGPLFQGRFKAELTDTEMWAAEVNRYIHLNPVRTSALALDKRRQAESASGLRMEPPSREMIRERLRRLREYRWSSCRAYLGLEKAPEWLTVAEMLSSFGGRSRAEQTANYRRALEECLREGLPENPWDRAVGGAILGGEKFVERIRKALGKPDREVPGSRVAMTKRSFEGWCVLMERLCGDRWEQIAQRHGDVSRDLVLLAARTHSRLKLSEIAEKVQLDYGTVANALYRIRRKIEGDKKTAKQWQQLIKCSNQKT